MNTKSLAALTALAIGLTFAPAAWAAGEQMPAGQKRVHRTHPVQAQRKPIPQNSCDYDRAAGRCMIDLGYGRCVSCDSGGPAR